MGMPHRVNVPRGGMRPGSMLFTALLLLSLVLVASSCGGDARLQQQANQSKSQLDTLLLHAKTIGVPASALQPLIKQEQQLSSSSAPFSLFNDQPINVYYQNLSIRYIQLQKQVQTQITTSTNQTQTQAQRDVVNLQMAMTRMHAKGFVVQNWNPLFSQLQAQLTTAKYPKDYAQISSQARSASQGLDLMQSTSDKLTTLNNTIAQLKQAYIDATALQQQYQSDQQTFAKAFAPADFQHLDTMIDAQYQQAVVTTQQALPYVTAARYDELQIQVNLLKTYGMDANSMEQRLAADQVRMDNVHSIADYVNFSKQIDTDMASMHDDLIIGGARYVVKQLHQEIDAWSKANLYHNPFDGQTYSYDASYDLPASNIDDDLAAAQTLSDYQGVMDETNNTLYNLHLLEADFKDKTPYNQVHATDLQALNNYKLQGKQVLVVSLVEQAMRVYQDGKLVNSFLVTTGRYERPSVPGVWPILDRQSPTEFYSDDPPGSPFYYPPTPIHYAMLYHWGGYFVHDSWWRASYGPGTQFPHADASGDTVYSGNGSHGCINMQEDQAAWVYTHTDINTIVVIY